MNAPLTLGEQIMRVMADGEERTSATVCAALPEAKVLSVRHRLSMLVADGKLRSERVPLAGHVVYVLAEAAS